MSIAKSIRAQIPPIHSEGYPFIGGFALASLILFWIWTPLGWIGTVLTVWCALFFRDPVRVTPVREGIVMSPSDGRVSMIEEVLPPAELGLDVYLHEGGKSLVSEGQTAVAGETVLADLGGNDQGRTFRAN